MEFYSCNSINNLHLNIFGRIDKEEPVITLCCEEGISRPGIPLMDTAEETLENFLKLHALVVKEGMQSLGGVNTTGCKVCNRYYMGEHKVEYLISRVNLSMYPAPCQCKCSYCYVPKQWINSSKVADAYEKLFEMLELAESRGIIRSNASWQVATGEITIHPYKDKIMNLVQGKRVSFHTNVFLYDKDIARSLHENKDCFINFSIDAGTRDTWYKVKGYDNFEEVTSNLVRYYEQSVRQGQILLKYIVLPGINDSDKDYLALVELMKRIDVTHLIISRDIQFKYDEKPNEQTELLHGAARLLAVCHKNGISCKIENTYTGEQKIEMYKSAGIAQEKIEFRQFGDGYVDTDF